MRSKDEFGQFSIPVVLFDRHGVRIKTEPPRIDAYDARTNMVRTVVELRVPLNITMESMVHAKNAEQFVISIALLELESALRFVKESTKVKS